MIELIINNIDGFRYTLNNEYFIDIELFDYQLQVNDKIYLDKRLLNKNILYRFGKTYKDSNIKEKDIIKVVRDNEKFYLQRYYG